MNAHGHNSATSYFDDETSGAFYSWELTLPRGANNSNMRDNVPFPRACHIFLSFYYFGFSHPIPHTQTYFSNCKHSSPVNIHQNEGPLSLVKCLTLLINYSYVQKEYISLSFLYIYFVIEMFKDIINQA